MSISDVNIRLTPLKVNATLSGRNLLDGSGEDSRRMKTPSKCRRRGRSRWRVADLPYNEEALVAHSHADRALSVCRSRYCGAEFCDQPIRLHVILGRRLRGGNT